jgi:outer membrane protein assembly factor BamD
MMDSALRTRTRVLRVLAVAFLLGSSVACGPKGPVRPPDPALADRFLFERGTDALTRRKWLDAREYFREIVENYPLSPHRADAKLGIGDAYLGENTAESLVLAANEFREFLQFYAAHPRADYAQYKLAMTFYAQMRAPDRDQTPTKEALVEFDTFFARYPNSPLMPEVKEKWRVARDRLSAWSYGVGLGYYRRRWYPGAIDRFREVIRDDPGFSQIDGVYYHLAESYARTDKKAEAIPLLDRLVSEYKTSEHLEKAQERLEELKAQ